MYSAMILSEDQNLKLCIISSSVWWTLLISCYDDWLYLIGGELWQKKSFHCNSVDVLLRFVFKLWVHPLYTALVFYVIFLHDLKKKFFSRPFFVFILIYIVLGNKLDMRSHDSFTCCVHSSSDLWLLGLMPLLKSFYFQRNFTP